MRALGHLRLNDIRRLCAGLALALLLGSCGGGNQGDGAQGEDVAAGTGSEGAGSCEGSSITIGTNGDAQNINPLIAIDLDGFWRTDLMFDPLVKLDPETMEPIPHLAESWEVSDDALTYTFTLADDATFHDGKPLTAQDVEFTILSTLQDDYTGIWQPNWLRLAGAQEYLDGSAEKVKGLEVLDDHTIRMTLAEPYAPFLSVIARQLKPVPKHLLEGEGTIGEEHPFSLSPVGSGPYKFESWTKGESFSMVANEDYWGGTPCMKHITQRVIPDMNTLVVALESGDLDASIMPPPAELARLAETPGLTVHELPAERPEGLFFNLEHEDWAKPELRRAVAHGIDYTTFVEEFMAGATPEADNHVSPASWAHDPDVAVPDYDPEQAKQLLEEAGYPGGEGLSMELFTNQGNLFRDQEVKFIQDQLGQIGIDVEVKMAEWGVFTTAVREGDFVVNAQAALGGIPDPADIAQHYHTNGGSNYSNYSNPEVDRLLDEAESISDRDRRKELYSQVQEILAEDLPFLPGFWRPNSLVVHDEFKNVEPSVLGAYWNIQDWSVQQ